jgi:NADH dehydrogenase
LHYFCYTAQNVDEGCVMKTRLVIVGGGYAGATLVHYLSNFPMLEITLIDASSYHLAQTKLHRYLTGEINFDEIAYDFAQFCSKNGANFIQGRVSDIDTTTKSLHVNEQNIEYDYLVLATGSVSLFPKQIENIHTFAIDLKNPNELQIAKEKVDKLFIDNSKEHTIAIIGAGLSGAEIALEFAQKARQIPHIKVALIEQKPTPLPGSDPRLIDAVTKACDALHVKRYHGAFVTKIEPDFIQMSDGSSVPFSLALFVIGVSPTLPQFSTPLPKNPQGLVIVDENYHVENLEGVFALGDIVYSKDSQGEQNLPTAQVAKQQAKSLARYLKAKLSNRRLPKPKPIKNKGVLVDLGGKDAAGLSFGVPISGKSAYLAKRLVCRMHTRIFNSRREK